MKSNLNSLGKFAGKLASSVPKIQQEFDQNFETDLSHFQELYPALETILGETAFDLHPRRMMIESINLTGRFQLSINKEAEQRVNIFPINASHSVRYKSTRTSKVTLEVEQVPAPLNINLEKLTQK